MGLIKVCLIIIAIVLYAALIINIIKIKKALNNSIGKKIEDVIPEFDKFMNKYKIYIILASIISFMIIIFFKN